VDRARFADQMRQDASAGAIQGVMRGRQSRGVAKKLAENAFKEETLVDVGKKLLACLNDSTEETSKDQLQAIMAQLFSVVDPVVEEPEGSAEAAGMARELENQMTSQTMEKLETEMELKEVMKSNWALEQELGDSQQHIATLQDDAIKASAELEMANIMAAELQLTLTKEREQLEDENAYLAQQLLLSHQSAKRGGSPRSPKSMVDEPELGSARDLPFFKDLNSEQQYKATTAIANMKSEGYRNSQIIAACKALLATQTAPSMKAVWEVCDVNRKNFLDVNTFKRALYLVGENVPDDEMDLLFEMADEDGSGKIVFSEFVMLCRALNLKEPYF